MMEIHWDKTDIGTEDNPGTAVLLATGKLTPTQVNYGKFLMDYFENEFIQYLYETNYLAYTSDMHKATPEQKRNAAKQKAKDKVSSRWYKGMLPAMQRRYTDALTQGDKGDAFTLFMGDISREEGVFEQYYEGETNPSTTRYRHMTAHFWDQFSVAGANGSERRMKQLGLGDKNGQMVVVSPDNQRNLSMDLQSIGNYTIAASARARNLEDAIDAVNVSLDLLNGLKAKKGIKTTNIIDQMRVYVDRNVFGVLPDSGHMKIGAMTFLVDDAWNAANKLITIIAMALSPMLGLKNFMASEIKMWSNALANQWSKNGWFTPQHVAEATSEVLTNFKKVDAINRKYLLVAMSERDILNHALYNETRRNIMEGDALMISNFAGDYINQLIGCVAQMKADGTWDAHDEEGNYNTKKDTRFYDASGKILPDSDLMMESIKQDLIREKRFKQHYDPNGKLLGAYNNMQTNRIKVLVGRYVAELTDNQYKNMSNAYGLVRVAMSLKNFMTNVGHEWFQKAHYETALGKNKIVDDGKGGKKVVWDAMLVEGVAITFFSALKMLKDHRGDTKKTWEDLSDVQKRNLAKMLSFSISLGAIYALINMLDFGDEEEKDKPAWKTQLNYLLLGSGRENLSQINPYQLVVDYRRSPTPLLKQMENYENILTGTILLPMKGYEDGAAVTIDNWLYLTSKGIPGGALYRDMRKTSDDFIDGMLEHMKNNPQQQ